MAERDYAFEMWRLLDPESNLISPRELLDRIVCVKSGMYCISFSPSIQENPLDCF